MSKPALFFDADDTLLDFKDAEREALALLFKNHGYMLTEERRQSYHEMNDRLWKSYEKGEITREYLLSVRFSSFFASLGVKVNGPEMESEYRGYLAQGCRLIDGAREVCAELSKEHRMFIVTNGVSQTQRSRLRAAGIANLFEEVFISSEIGWQKPRKEFFDCVFERLPGILRAQSLIIGDSLSSDIQGGVNAGMFTCWYNPSGLAPKGSSVKPDYEIRSLRELPAVVNRVTHI